MSVYHNTVNLRAVPRFVPHGRSVVFRREAESFDGKKRHPLRRGCLFYDHLPARSSASFSLARLSLRRISFSSVGCSVVIQVSCPFFADFIPKI